MAQAAGAGMASLLATEPAFAKGKAAMPPPAPKKDSKKASKKDSKAASAPSGVDLIKTLFDGSVPAGGIVSWYEKNLAKDFTAEFAGGKVVFDRKQYIGLTKDILASVPDFTYTSPKHDFKKKGKNQVTWTAVVKGTHTGKPFSPIKGVPPAKPNKKAPAKLQNDPEAVTVTLNEAGQLSKLSVAAIKGGKGFSGPVGFYLQMGGDPKKLPKA